MIKIDPSAQVAVIIPAYNEEQSIQLVVRAIPTNCVRHIIVVDNNSTDNTAKLASDGGAMVLFQPIKGYGHACMMGALKARELGCEILVFMDGDFADFPEQTPRVLAPLLNQSADLVIGSRMLGNREKGSLMPQQIFGNFLATALIRIFFKHRFTDLGPFRALRTSTFFDLDLKEFTYGWTIEMQIKAVKKGLRCVEVPVDYKKRIGTSKVSGTVKGTILAGYKIISAVFKYL